LPDGNRLYSCDLVAPVSRFQVADLLVSKGGMESLEKRLKRVCTDEISSFLGEAKELLSGLKKVKTSEKKVSEGTSD
jgi:hypothetical protein